MPHDIRRDVSKVRVYELAKELGVESKVIVAKLAELGEFVKSASSTIEPPVARKLRDAFPAPAGGAPAAPKRSRTVAAPEPPASAEPAATAAPAVAAAPAAPAAPSVSPASPAPSAPAAPEVTAPAVDSDTIPAPRPAGPRPAAPRPATPRPGNNPFSSSPDAPPRPAGPRPGGPRPGNNPFSAGGSGMGRPGPRPGGPGGPGGPGRPGTMPRPPRPGGPGGPGGPGAGRPGAPMGARPGGPGAGRPGGGAGGPGRPGFGGGPGRPGGGGGGRGSTGGAFGRPGGAPRGKSRKSKRAKRQEFDNMQAPTLGGIQVPRGNGQVVRLARGASLSDFAEKIGANPASLVQLLFGMGEMVTATQSVSDDTLELLGAELNFDVQVVSPEDEDRELLQSFDLEFDGDVDEANLSARPPVVTVMGHVDHGKTRLLDAIRNTNVVAKEAGGITQHIGAYQVHRVHDGMDRAITFIDTPGHEAFTAMRARGASTTDIVILVVAADDGIKPQTIEALNHAQAANVPIVVAVNKIDKEGADPTKVRAQLTEYGLVAEDFGGDTMFVNVSALTGAHIDDLLDSILLTADAALDLRADATTPAQGTAIEAHLDRGRGPVATVLVQRGTLRPGDSIVCGDAHGRVRAMLDENGDPIDEALPSRPVQVLGLTSVPGAGDSFLVVPEDRVARQIAQAREARERNAALARARGRRTLEDFLKQLEQGEVQELNLIIKGDVSGSVEALEEALLKIDVGEDISVRVIHRGVGAINKNDVMLASASKAVILGFNVRPEGKVGEMAEREGIDVRFYNIIYQAIDDIEAALKGMLKPEFEEVQLGTAEVREVFRSSKFGTIAGSMVSTGLIRRNAKARLVRDGVVVANDLTIHSLRRFKDDATEVREGFECGIGLGSYNDIKVGDLVETYEMREKPRG